MADAGYLLFDRNGQENQEDVWDDSALIEAYDRAVNLAKEKVAARLSSAWDGGESSALESADSESGRTKKEKKPAAKWNPGDFVRATYSQDGEVYEAVVEKLTKGRARIKFIGYDNVEEVPVHKLLPTSGPESRHLQAESAASAAAEASSDEMDSETLEDAAAAGNASRRTLLPPWKPVMSSPGKRQKQNSGRSLPMPPPPPPPPPSAWPSGGIASGDQDSLYSMLMSWYMAGYHTGYYQGQQQANKD